MLLRAGSAILLACSFASIREASAKPEFDLAPLRLTVAVVNDPEFPPLERELAEMALLFARREFARRFDVPEPEMEIVNEFSLAGFLGTYALPVDPRCKPLYDARYHGGGSTEVLAHRNGALKFLEKWDMESLRGFIDEPDKSSVRTHEDIFAYYAKKYVRTTEAMKGLKTPANTALVEPQRSARRSFVAWTCALLRQTEYDVILTNTFILADLLTEPHPHAVFGKAKVGGIAARSPARPVLGGQALLATTFGIDTKLPEFSELPGEPPTLEERAKILGTYLLAHEIAHAVFGIPDVFDHPPGCLMTTRPGATYRDGLVELEKHPQPCPKCRPYVEARSTLDRAERFYLEGKYVAASTLALKSAKVLPKHFHGGRKRRMAQVMVLASKAYREQGKKKEAESFAKAALDLDPSSDEVAALFPTPVLVGAMRQIGTTSTSTTRRQ